MAPLRTTPTAVGTPPEQASSLNPSDMSRKLLFNAYVRQGVRYSDQVFDKVLTKTLTIDHTP